jgi:hypothetical protein
MSAVAQHRSDVEHRLLADHRVGADRRDRAVWIAATAR